MEDQQFQRLLQELLANHRELIAKLEGIRCGLIDVETASEAIKDEMREIIKNELNQDLIR